MRTNSAGVRIGLVILAGALAAGRPVPAEEAVATERVGENKLLAEKTPPVTALVSVKGKSYKMTFVARSKEKLVYVMGAQSVGAQKELHITDVESVVFDIRLDFTALTKASRSQNWPVAIGLLLPAVKTSLPYLDLPNNNAADLALELGDYMLRLADLMASKAKTEKEKETTEKQYRGAYTVLRYVNLADWCTAGPIGGLKSIKCLLALNRAKTAQEEIDKIQEPEPGDAAYGLYWLVRAEIEVTKGQFRPAMDATVKSLCFENKDIDTFPDALMLSARCYEEIQQWYRARDVYFEVAKIFPNTDWSRSAKERLTFIMEKGYTKEEEAAPIESIFFALKEDVNKRVTDLLNGVEEKDRGRSSARRTSSGGGSDNTFKMPSKEERDKREKKEKEANDEKLRMEGKEPE